MGPLRTSVMKSCQKSQTLSLLKPSGGDMPKASQVPLMKMSFWMKSYWLSLQIPRQRRGAAGAPLWLPSAVHAVNRRARA